MAETQNATEASERRRKAFSIRDLAEFYGISQGLVRVEIARGNLRVARIGRRVVVPAEAVSQWLSREVDAPPAKPQAATR